MRQAQAVVRGSPRRSRTPESLQSAPSQALQPSHATHSHKSVRVGTASVALMNRSIVPPARNQLPRWISSPAISPTMYAKQLLIVPRPKTSNHKAISAAGDDRPSVVRQRCPSRRQSPQAAPALRHANHSQLQNERRSTLSRRVPRPPPLARAIGVPLAARPRTAPSLAAARCRRPAAP
jgi:hypothetical protein